MDYPETLQYLYSQLPMFQRIGPAAYKADLSNTLKMCHILGNPENSFKSVHVAGTNGKGSVSHKIASILQEAGYKTGLYTSPHLKDFKERIRVNGQMVSESFVVKFVENHNENFESIGLSFFEMTVGMAFEYFKQQKVDIAVIETGMGGRLDSTNVLQPEVSVITNIGYDHMQFLGESLPEIALEKAAIIKKGIPAIIGERQEEVSSIFVDRANEVGTDLFFADQMNLPEIESGLKGNWQKKNSRTALAAITLLKEKGFLTKQEHLIRGLKNVANNTGLMGRWQLLQENPLAICDIGHNLDGIKEVLAMLRQTPHQKLHFVLGMVADKNVEPVLKLLPSSATYYFCKADIPRGLDAAKLQGQALKSGLSGDVYPSVKDAYDQALRNAAPDDLVFAGGSTFVVAEIV